MKYSYLLKLFLVLCFQLSCTDWIRKLPEKNYETNAIVKGVWEKRTNPRSAMNSSFHKNIWSEKIEFDVPSNGKFRKIYEKKDIFGEKIIRKKVTGIGDYSVKGNWVLLSTKKIEVEESENEKTQETKRESFDHILLYHYDKDSLTLIPMTYESGYQEKNFGMKDGVSMPYAEDKNFFISRKIYLYKDFQSHAYFLKNAE
ncbi:MAG: hypothetical protein K8R21_16000 [Leptospira sp.]|nr:hypothetical protein [Leptospira sp.]